MGEQRFYADIPHADRGEEPPPILGIVAEEVVFGLKTAIDTIRQERQDQHLHERNLNDALSLFIRFIEESKKVAWQPHLVVGAQDITASRLGMLLDGEYALFGDEVILQAGQNYPINYTGKHRTPYGAESHDVLPGTRTELQWYLGFAKPTIDDMNGYAISINHFLKATAEGLELTAFKS